MTTTLFVNIACWLIAIICVVLGFFGIPDQYGLPFLSSGLESYGVFSAGLFSIGIYSAGVFSVGIFSAGLFSFGLVSVGVFNLAIYTGIGIFVRSFCKGKGFFVAAPHKKTLKDLVQ